MLTSMHRFIIFSLFFLFVLQPVRTQTGSAAFPFLLINPSTEANGMGGSMISVTPTSPTSTSFNPAQLGIMSRTYTFSSDFYANVTLWLPAFHLPDLWLNNYSMMYGVNLGDTFPNEVSVGVGYSRMFLNLGDFIFTNGRSPDVITTYRGYEEVDNYSLGVSMDVGPIIGFGTTVKRIQSHLSPTGISNAPENPDVIAVDLGVVTKFPLFRYLVTDNESLQRQLQPYLDLTLSYAINNLGGDVSYGNSFQKDPMPRTARVGWSVETGIVINTAAISLPFVQLTLAREVNDVLVKRKPEGTSWEYKGLLGDINLFKGLVESRQHRYVDVHRGFSIGMLETITYRQGSFDGGGNLVYKTNGITYSTRGLFSLIGSLIYDENNKTFAQYFLRHFEVRISQSEYSGHEIVGGTKFKSVLFSFHQ